MAPGLSSFLSPSLALMSAPGPPPSFLSPLGRTEKVLCIPMWLILGSACSLSLAAGWRRTSDAQATLRRLSFAFWTHNFDPSGTWMFWLKTCAAPSVCRLFIRSVIRRCLMCLVAHCKCMLQLRYLVCGNSQNSIHIKPATSAECSQPEASDRSSDRSARRPRGTKQSGVQVFSCSSWTSWSSCASGSSCASCAN